MFPLSEIAAHNMPVISVKNAIADPCIKIETSNVCSTGSGSGSTSAQNNTFTNTRDAVLVNKILILSSVNPGILLPLHTRYDEKARTFY